MPLTVTLDTNAFNDVISPETSQRGEQGRLEAALFSCNLMALFRRQAPCAM
jgi:hypothetical protein